jgi:hypothetical protein
MPEFRPSTLVQYTKKQTKETCFGRRETLD